MTGTACGGIVAFDSASAAATRLGQEAGTAQTSMELALEPAQREAVADEMADVLIYLLQMARVTGIDLEAAAEAKLAKNARKYPASPSP